MRNPGILAMILSVILIHGCKKEDKPATPVIETKEVTEISYTTATSGGNATSEGGAPVISRGVCWNTAVNPTIANSKTTETGGTGSFTSKIIELTPNTLYYLRAYATNSIGTAYGDQVSFTTMQADPPVLTTTSEVTHITYTTAISGGNVTNEGGTPVVSRGVCWNTAANPTIANSKTTETGGTGSFSTNLAQLTPHTLYYVRAYATNSSGTGYGDQVSFTTMQAMAPSITTTSVTSFTATTAVAGGNITAENGAAVTARGICWSTHPDPTTSDNQTSDGSGPGIFTSTLTGLTANTTYYLKAYAINSEATRYGDVISFKTCAVNDIDGNGYNSVVIGTQTWMVEDLKTTKYNDGTAIPLVTDKTEWLNLVTPGYCWYNNDEAAYKSIYGALYNWYAVNTGKLCPSGWHVPTHSEWTTLSDFLGGDTESPSETSTAGGKLKETGFAHWTSPNAGATNETGFTALASGFRNWEGDFSGINYYGAWWTSTESGTRANFRTISWARGDLMNMGTINKFEGASIRCLKD